MPHNENKWNFGQTRKYIIFHQSQFPWPNTRRIKNEQRMKKKKTHSLFFCCWFHGIQGANESMWNKKRKHWIENASSEIANAIHPLLLTENIRNFLFWNVSTIFYLLTPHSLQLHSHIVGFFFPLLMANKCELYVMHTSQFSVNC